MYTPNLHHIAEFNIANAREFVGYWSHFYRYNITVPDTKEQIDYLSELNIGNDLTEENVRRLLRWKDPQRLTHPIQSGPNASQDNRHVVKVLAALGQLNRFRNEQSTENEMKDITAQIFPNGMIWQIFLLHIAKPDVYPIADQHVFRAFSLDTPTAVAINWETYDAYKGYFGRIAQAVNVAQTPDNIRQLKRIDNALMVFGQFLKAYCEQ